MTDEDARMGARLGVALAASLRSLGVDVPTSSVVTLTEALARTGLDDRRTVYWTTHACLIRRPEDRPAFERAFAAFFDDRIGIRVEEPPPEPVTIAVDDPDADPDADGGHALEPDNPVLALRWSALEVLRTKDFADCTLDELAETHRLIARLRIPASTRPSRRRVPTPHRRGDIDVARTVRRALRTDAEALELARTDRGQRARRLVVICDVSGSMDRYSRALLRFAHAATVGRRRVEVFAIGTRLTRLTRALRSRDPDAALDAAGDEIHDFSGGTRLGESLALFADRWGVRGLARGAVLVICSDGWDRGDPAILADAMARLHRVTHRLVWVNPLKASPGYAPLARGMAAALPSIDEFVEGHSVDSLERLAELLAA